MLGAHVKCLYLADGRYVLLREGDGRLKQVSQKPPESAAEDVEVVVANLRELAAALEQAAEELRRVPAPPRLVPPVR